MKTSIKISFMLLMSIILSLIYVYICMGTEISLGLGQDLPVERLQSDGLRCSIAQIEISRDFKSPWYGSLIVARMHGQLKSAGIIDGNHFEKSTTSPMLAFRLGVNKKLIGQFSGRFFGGFGYLPKDLPEIGDSYVVGHFGGQVTYNIGRWGIGYQAYHVSDPCRHGDHGWNLWLLTIGREF